MILVLALAFQTGAAAPAGDLTATYLANFPHFNASIEANAPGDVDTAFEAALTAKGQFSLVQREFELYAWQLFNAVNSPNAIDQKEIGLPGHGISRWEEWLRAKDVVGDPNVCARYEHPVNRPENIATRTRRLSVISTLSSNDMLDSIAHPSPANTPLIDQHGNFVFYESLIDPNQVAYICARGIQSRSAPFKTPASGMQVSFPEGSETVPWSGSYTLKLAWRVLNQSKGDVLDRYYTDDAQILDLTQAGQPFWRKVTVGLVGMHLVHKTRSAHERIWATFEHVDNLDVDTVGIQGVTPSFTNPFCPLCAQNRPSASPLERVPTQVARMSPIPLSTEKLNAEAQQVFASRGSIWQYYKLVGVQWPGVAGDSTSATPPYLVNAVMETFSQLSLGSAHDPETVSRSDLTAFSCMACHDRAAVSGRGIGSGGPQKVDFSWFMAKRQPPK